MLTACSPSRQAAQSGPPPTLERQLAHLDGGPPVAQDEVYRLVAGDTRTVLVGMLLQENPVITFRYSDDDGATWTVAEVPTATTSLGSATCARWSGRC